MASITPCRADTVPRALYMKMSGHHAGDGGWSVWLMSQLIPKSLHEDARKRTLPARNQKQEQEAGLSITGHHESMSHKYYSASSYRTQLLSKQVARPAQSVGSLYVRQSGFARSPSCLGSRSTRAHRFSSHSLRNVIDDTADVSSGISDRVGNGEFERVHRTSSTSMDSSVSSACDRTPSRCCCRRHWSSYYYCGCCCCCCCC